MTEDHDDEYGVHRLKPHRSRVDIRNGEKLRGEELGRIIPESESTCR